LITIGVDGCRGGWFAVALQNGAATFELFPDIQSLWRAHRNARRILIDIPIGLPAGGPRTCDIEARRLLPAPRRSSVFPIPCREAVHAPDYRSACELNERRLGKRLTKQTWNICPKIAEVDDFLRGHKTARRRLREAHPELCFQGLAGRPLAYRKKTREGSEERLAILGQRTAGPEDILQAALGRYPRSRLAADDVLDALVLAVTPGLPAKQLAHVPKRMEYDEAGLPTVINFAACQVQDSVVSW
jgi:predicted RNase H-like nuclease